MTTEDNPNSDSTQASEEAAAETKPKASTRKPASPKFHKERQRFQALVLANPNYFGNLKNSPFQPVLDIQSNTFYEELGCVGFQPQFNRLDAVVYVKQPSGYGGTICSNGSREYVRFYLSFDNGATWEDQGVSSFKAYNIPEGTSGQKRLEYAVSLQIDPVKKLCFLSNLALVRGILSWNVPPPPNDPDFTPVWGEVHDTHIQIDPRKFIIVGELLDLAKVKLSAQVQSVVDLSKAVPVAEPPTLGVAKLHRLYQDKGVEPHRFALTELKALADQPSAVESAMVSGFKGLFPELDIDLVDIAEKLFPVGDGSVRYEELECIGLNPNQDALVGVVRVKLPNGYSGGPCTGGSKEYVTFWADFDDNGTFETCLGTTSVKVYDIDRIPKEGLEYSVFLPVDLSQYRKPCQAGPKLVKIRAILSWQIAPPCANPNYVPVWGNREETLIHIKPGDRSPQDSHAPIIQTVGGMDVGDIGALDGLANGAAVTAGFTAQDSPFGGEVIIGGRIAHPPDISSGATRLKYKVEVSNDGGASWQPVANKFTLKRDQLLNGLWSDLPDIDQIADVDNFYEYQEDLIDGPGNAQYFPVGNVLARWQTGGLPGLWRIRITVKDPSNPGPVWVSNVVTVRIDSEAPKPNIDITAGGGACADFTIGDVISGTYSVSDAHFGRLRLRVLPGLGGSFTSPAPYPGVGTMPLNRRYNSAAPPGVPGTGEAGSWSLDTTGMPACGYIVELASWDRTIVNSGFVGRFAREVVGFCLREEETE